MASRNGSERTRIDIGEGDFVDLAVASDGRWLFDFIGAPTRTAPRPKAEEVKVEAITDDGQVVPLMVSDSASGGWVEASGRTAGASYVRVAVPHDTHTHVRSVPLAAGAKQNPRLGPAGGAMMDIGHGSHIEVVSRRSGRLDLSFLRDGKPDDHAPSADIVKVDSIAQSGMVRPLLVTAGDSASQLAASGSLEGVNRVRVTITHDGHAHTHEVSLVSDPKA